MKEQDAKLSAELLGSFLKFTSVFFKIRTGREFVIGTPPGRESHFITMARAFTRLFNGEIDRLYIGMPPRYGKSELACNFVAWTLAHYPDSNYIYASYALSPAKRQTQLIRDIVSLPHYKKMFGVSIQDDTSAKSDFKTNYNGEILGVGTGGPITSRGAGIRNCDRWGGCIIIDDVHKPMDVTSEVSRESDKFWYYDTLLTRLNNPTNHPRTPILIIGHRLHEDDLYAHLLTTNEFETVMLPALDMHNNPLDPNMHSKDMLLKMEHESPYTFYAQYQQNPQPAGGGIFKRDQFVLLDEEPDLLATFITCDTAESDKDHGDFSVFSFWGIYKIKEAGVDTNILGLHLIDCYEFKCEPKDLEPEFRQFYATCLRHKVKPVLCGIEKKSTGVTLLSVLQSFRGLKMINIERTKASGNKVTRFLSVQSIVYSKRVSLLRDALHTDNFLTHMSKITANNTHRHDDIADTFYDACKIGLIDQLVYVYHQPTDATPVVNKMGATIAQMNKLKQDAYYGRR